MSIFLYSPNRISFKNEKNLLLPMPENQRYVFNFNFKVSSLYVEMNFFETRYTWKKTDFSARFSRTYCDVGEFNGISNP